jgi:hypothetical protein
MLAHRLRRVLLALFLRFFAFRKVGSSFSTVFQGATFLSFAARLDDAFPIAFGVTGRRFCSCPAGRLGEDRGHRHGRSADGNQQCR